MRVPSDTNNNTSEDTADNGDGRQNEQSEFSIFCIHLCCIYSKVNVMIFFVCIYRY